MCISHQQPLHLLLFTTLTQRYSVLRSQRRFSWGSLGCAMFICTQCMPLFPLLFVDPSPWLTWMTTRPTLLWWTTEKIQNWRTYSMTSLSLSLISSTLITHGERWRLVGTCSGHTSFHTLCLYSASELAECVNSFLLFVLAGEDSCITVRLCALYHACLYHGVTVPHLHG